MSIESERIDWEIEDQRYGVRREGNDGLLFVIASIALALVLAGLFFTQPLALLGGGVTTIACYLHGVYPR